MTHSWLGLHQPLPLAAVTVEMMMVGRGVTVAVRPFESVGCTDGGPG